LLIIIDLYKVDAVGWVLLHGAILADLQNLHQSRS
jgi:hypothetical protein